MRLVLPLCVLLASAAVISACGKNDKPAEKAVSTPTAGTGEKDDHGVSTDPAGATRFITSDSSVPETAQDKKGDGVLRDADGRPFTYALLGKPLPAFTGPMLDGNTFSTDNLTGWTVLDVWGIWCGDCRADGPYTAKLSTALEAREDITFLSLHTPPNAARASEAYGTFGSVENYFGQMGYDYPVILDADAALRDLLEIAWTPTYLLIGPDRTIHGFRTDLSVAGEDPVDAFIADIERVMQEAE